MITHYYHSIVHHVFILYIVTNWIYHYHMMNYKQNNFYFIMYIMTHIFLHWEYILYYIQHPLLDNTSGYTLHAFI